MTSRPHPHPPEVKAEALRRLASGDRPSLVAREMGVSLATLRAWRSASGHAKPDRGRRSPDGRFLPGYTPNPGGSTTALEKAQRLLEEAAPANVQRLLGLAGQLHEMGEKSPGSPGRLDQDQGRWSQETRATLEAVLKPLARSIASRAEAERLRAEAELERERARLEAERAAAARLDLSRLTDKELELLEELHAKARRA